MLLHPYTDRIEAYQGTRLLQETLGIIGMQLQDLYDPSRIWTIQSLFAPVPQRMLGGIRAKLVDQKSFVSFVNQRDLEVLLGLASPGEYCHWTGTFYLGPDDPDWCGLCVDDDDLADDLQERELLLRATTHPLQSGVEILRRVHHEQGVDSEELLTLLWDRDPETGIEPDARLATVDRRWARIERRRMQWPRVL